MYSKEMFIKYIKADDENRILVSVQQQFEEHLKNEQGRQKIKETLAKVLNDKFEKLEVGKNVCRITVQDGTTEECITLIEEEINKMLAMAAQFMENMSPEDLQNLAKNFGA